MKLESVNINSEDISFTTLNLLVGSNNAGKSTLLKEIHGSVMSGIVHAGDSKWIDSAQLKVSGLKDELKKFFRGEDISQIDSYDNRHAAEILGFKPFRRNMSQNLRSYNLSSIMHFDAYINNYDISIDIPKLESSDQLSMTNEHLVRRFLADIEVQGEFCDSRLSSGFNTSIQDILQDNGDQSPVRHLRESPELMKNIQNNIQSVFGVKVGFDDLQQGQKPLRILPQNKFSKKLDQKSLAVMWRDRSPLVDSQGDGLRAYLKIALSLLDPFSRMIFIDEPETFLHPPQRRALGSLIADMARRQGKQVFIATHDSEFIRGLLNAGSDVKVLNLRNRQEAHSLVEMDLRDIKSVLNQRGNRLKERAPILNEAILDSLFYSKTILTEDENDRVFYEYYSMLRHGSSVQGMRFLGMRGIEEVLNLMDKLNSLGVNIGCIVDIDFIVDRHAPQYIRASEPNLHTAHVAIRREFNSMNRSDQGIFRKGLQRNGVRFISDESQRQKYEDLISRYAKVGVFIVNVGVLESWTGVSKNNLSEMLRIIEARNPRELNRFMKVVLGP